MEQGTHKMSFETSNTYIILKFANFERDAAQLSDCPAKQQHRHSRKRVRGYLSLCPGGITHAI